MLSGFWPTIYITFIHLLLFGWLILSSLGLYHLGIGLVSTRKNGFWIDRTLPIGVFLASVHMVDMIFTGYVLPELVFGCQTTFAVYFATGMVVGVIRRLRINQG